MVVTGSGERVMVKIHNKASSVVMKVNTNESQW